MLDAPSIKTLMAENEQLLKECAQLREENAQFRKMLRENKVESAFVTTEPTAIRLTEECDYKPDLVGNVPPLLSLLSNKAESIDKYSDADKKVSLFQSLFRGRSDVYAKQWKGKGEKPGYSPACVNEWVRGVCGKPKLKCSTCSYAEYLSYDANAIEQHLRGKCVIGIYPLLTDDTCAFLAIDFDETSWRKDVRSVADICLDHTIPHALEVSRSGNGAHLWFFFDAPISAAIARQFGTLLLTQAMQRHAKLEFSSYDRMFPNQDTLSKGGFGNLIALPLQKEARANGCSLFVDADFQPYDDQWEFLSSLSRITTPMLEDWISTWHSPPLGELRIDDGDDQKPWKREKLPFTSSDCPSVANCVLADMLYIPTTVFSDRAQNRIKRLAAFRNPLFYQAQAMRMPIWNKPRIICCAEYRAEYLCLPRGCAEDLSSFATEYNFRIAWQDERITGISIDVSFRGELRSEQQSAFDALSIFDSGVLSATTAFGKTVIGAALIGQKRVNTLVLVHRKQLLTQWQERLAEFLEIHEALPEEPRKRGKKKQRAIIGTFGAGKDARSGIIDVAIMQSMGSADQIKDFIKDYGMVIIDECHHIPAVSFENVMKQVQSTYVYGLTATPTRQDGHHPILYMYLGPIRYRVDAKEQAAKRPFSHVMVPRFTGAQFQLEEQNTSPVIGQYYSQMITDDLRNHMIVEDVLACVKEGRNCLLLSERTKHVQLLASLLSGQVPGVLTLTGGKTNSDTKKQLDALRNAPTDQPLVLCATGKYIGEGFDEPRLDTLFLTMPISWHGTLAQYAGRLHRLHVDKREVRIYDYVDHSVEMLERMYHKRLKGYASIGYQVSAERETTEIGSDIIYDQNKFQERFISDMINGKKQIVIVSPYATLRRIRWLESTLSQLCEKEIQVVVITRPASSFQGKAAVSAQLATDALLLMGVTIHFRDSIHQKYAIIDDKIVWYGSVNLLSFGASQESIMRLVSGSIARALMSNSGE